MTTTHLSPLVVGPYATFDLPATSILWTAAMVNLKTSPTLVGRARAYGSEVSPKKEQYHDQQHEQHQCRSPDISMNGQKV